MRRAGPVADRRLFACLAATFLALAGTCSVVALLRLTEDPSTAVAPGVLALPGFLMAATFAVACRPGPR
jgi:hypothetical protein